VTDVDDTKQALREEVWEALRSGGVARFPGTRGRIPNFTGAESAADRLTATDPWRAAATVKANPDAPQWPVRQRAVASGRTLFMAVPRLAADHPFVRLEADAIDASPRAATSIKGSSRHGVPTDVAALDPVDLVVVGCVAADRTGARLGKGGGYADLEFAVATAAGLIGPSTWVVTTVHQMQVVAAERIPMTAHDVPLDLIVTPDEVIGCDGGRRRPDGVLWDHLPDHKIAAIPLLQRLATQDS
jgi:5-formyltetrahydrofolate cyclo-ligase